MATSLNQVLAEARGLVTRLHDREKIADSMLSHCQTLHEKINCMKEYQADLHELNELCHQKPRTTLVRSLQQENRQIRQLQEENRQLKISLEEHQAALELIMQRYRKQMLRMVQMSRLQQLADDAFARLHEDENCVEHMGKLHDFAAVFSACLKMGEEGSQWDQEELAQLRTENRTLRELLRIAGTNDPRVVDAFNNFLKERSPTDSQLGRRPGEVEEVSTPKAETADWPEPESANGAVSNHLSESAPSSSAESDPAPPSPPAKPVRTKVQFSDSNSIKKANNSHPVVSSAAVKVNGNNNDVNSAGKTKKTTEAPKKPAGSPARTWLKRKPESGRLAAGPARNKASAPLAAATLPDKTKLQAAVKS